MGNSVFRERRIPEVPLTKPYQSPLNYGNSDYVSQARNFNTKEAPWNVTQWIDPFDPHPKLTTMPVLIIMRK